MTGQQVDPLAQARRTSWHDWRQRFAAAVEGSPPVLAPREFETTEEDLLLRTAGGGLRLDIEQMTLADWSELLIRALEDRTPLEQGGTPLWIFAPAVVHLGLGYRLREALMLVEKQSEEGPAAKDVVWMREWLSRLRDGPLNRSLDARPSCLLIAAAECSTSREWLPTRHYGALRLPTGRPWNPVLRALFDPGSTDTESGSTLAPPSLFLEMPPDEDSSPNETHNIKQWWKERGWPVLRLIKDEAKIEDDLQAIDSPQNLEDAMVRAAKLAEYGGQST